MKNLTFLLSIIALTLPLLVSANSINFNSFTPQEAFKLSNNSGKNVFINFTANWCLPCQMLEEHVFTDKEVQTILNEDFISVVADFDDIESQKWFDDYSIACMPNLIIANSEGIAIGQSEGSTNLEAFKAFLKSYTNTGYIANKDNDEPKAVKREVLIPAHYIKTESGATTTAEAMAIDIPTKKKSVDNKAPKTNSRSTKIVKSNYKIAERLEPSNPEINAKSYIMQFGAFSKYANALMLKNEVEKKLNIDIEIRESTAGLYKIIYSKILSASKLNNLKKSAVSRGLEFFVQT